MKRSILILVAVALLLLAGCSKEITGPVKPENRPPDVEPTATYDWMAGESPVPVKRMGVVRYGVNLFDHTVGPTGVYFLHDNYIYYADNGSDTFIKLCGRPSCTHDNEDCNAYVPAASKICYYNGYLYMESFIESEYYDALIRMEPDGSDHVDVLDLGAFAADKGADYAKIYKNTDGYCLIDTYKWFATSETEMTTKQVGIYIYKLDGSMKEPVEDKCYGELYHCGDTFRAMSEETRNGGEHGSIWAADLETGTMTYLLDHPGYTGYYDTENGYYFKEGKIICLNYATMEETVLVDTGLEQRYFLNMFPDCMVLASRTDDNPDPNLYIYNWNYELVDTVKLDYAYNGATHFMLLMETAERFFLTDTKDSEDAMPKYYINKSEFGSGNVKIHESKYE